MFIFDVKRFKVVTSGPSATVRRDKSGLIQVDSTKVWTDQRDTFVHPEHCQHVVFKADPKDPRWWFVVQVAPRNKPICEGLEDVSDHEEEAQFEDAQASHRLQQEDVGEEHQEEADEDAQYEEEQDEEEEALFQHDMEVNDNIEAQFNDEDAEMYIEIDLFGATDLVEDNRIDVEL